MSLFGVRRFHVHRHRKGLLWQACIHWWLVPAHLLTLPSSPPAPAHPLSLPTRLSSLVGLTSLELSCPGACRPQLDDQGLVRFGYAMARLRQLALTARADCLRPEVGGPAPVPAGGGGQDSALERTL
jgi:hypothetical protein